MLRPVYGATSVTDSINRPSDLDLWSFDRFTGFGLPRPFRSRVRSRHATDIQTDGRTNGQTDTGHHFIMPSLRRTDITVRRCIVPMWRRSTRRRRSELCTLTIECQASSLLAFLLYICICLQNHYSLINIVIVAFSLTLTTAWNTSTCKKTTAIGNQVEYIEYCFKHAEN